MEGSYFSFQVLSARNKLPTYGPIICAYSVITFFAWCYFWRYIYSESDVCYFQNDAITPQTINSNNTNEYDSQNSFKNYYFTICSSNENSVNGEVYKVFFYFTSGGFWAAFVIDAFHLWDNESKGSIRAVPILCSIVITFISFLSHLCMALDMLPVVFSQSSNMIHIVRLGEWIALAPLYLVMIHCLHIKNSSDWIFMWSSVFIQLISVVSAFIASSIRNKDISMAMAVISTACFFTMLLVLWKVINQRDFVIETESNAKALREKHRKIASLTRPKSLSAFMGTTNFEDVLGKLNILGEEISVKLTITYIITWMLFVCISSLKSLNIIDELTERILTSCIDVMGKLMFVRLLSSPHGAATESEHFLREKLYFEEKSNQIIKQFLHFIYHEISTPMNAIMMGLSFLKDEQLDADTAMSLSLTNESCIKINETLQDLIQYQEIEAGLRTVEMKPVKLKDLVNEVAARHIKKATAAQVTLQLGVDMRIPDLLLGEKLRLKQAFSTLISNGISRCPAHSKCTVMLQLKELDGCSSNSNEIKSFADIVFSVADEGVSISTKEIDNLNLFTFGGEGGACLPASEVGGSLQLRIAQRIAQIHGGDLLIEPLSNATATLTAAGQRGSKISCNIAFEIPQFSSSEEFRNIVEREIMRPLERRASEGHEEEGEEGGKGRGHEEDTSSKNSISSHHYSSNDETTSSHEDQENNATEPQESVYIIAPSVPIYNGTYYPAIASASSSPFNSPRRTAPLTAAVIDNVASYRKILTRSLQLLHFTVFSADDGTHLIDEIIPPGERCIKKTFDVIFLDNVMHLMSGIDTAMILREEGYKGLIVGITGSIVESDMKDFLDAGCDLVFSKPVDMESLIKALRNYNITVED